MDVQEAVELIKDVAREVFPGARIASAVEEDCGKVAIDAGDTQIFVSVIPGSRKGVSIAKFVTTPFLGCGEAFMTPEGLIAVLVGGDAREKIAVKLRALPKMPRARA